MVTYVLLTGRQPFTSPKSDDPMVVMRRIVDDGFQVKFPSYVSPAARDLVERLLERKVTRRLGALAGKARDVKRHKWFDGFDWGALSSRKMTPPRLPKDDAAKRIRDLVVSFDPGNEVDDDVYVLVLLAIGFKQGRFYCDLQSQERRQGSKAPKETLEELAEANNVFGEF